jgi:uncharacterized SAM-binding protein YcdF (DUF218 family)
MVSAFSNRTGMIMMMIIIIIILLLLPILNILLLVLIVAQLHMLFFRSRPDQRATDSPDA